MPARRARFARWTSSEDTNGAVSYDFYDLSNQDRAMGEDILKVRAQRDHVDLIWTAEDWELTDNFRVRYVNGYGIELNGLPNNAEWDSLASLVTHGCEQLMEAVERSDFSAKQFWQYIGYAHDDLKSDSFYDLITRLKTLTHKWDDGERTIALKTQIVPGHAWRAFVVRLAEQWRIKELRTRISRSNREKPSEFILWVAFMMGSVSEPLQQHMHGLKNGGTDFRALSQAVYEALAHTDSVLESIGPLGSTNWASYKTINGLRDQIKEWRDVQKYPNPAHHTMADDAETFLTSFLADKKAAS
jgi:hypothetical protein